MQVCLVLTLLIGIIGIIFSGKSLKVYIPLHEPVQYGQELHLHWDEGHMNAKIISLEEETLCIEFTAEQEGTHWIDIQSSDGDSIGQYGFKTTAHGYIYDLVTGSFSGCYALTCDIIFFCISFALILFHSFFSRTGSRLYSYYSILAFGMALFFSIFGINLSFEFSRHLLQPQNYGMSEIYSAFSSAAWSFIALTTPLILIFAVSLIVSNIQLLKYEGKSFQNLLSSIAGILMLSGMVLCYLMATRPFMGSVSELRIHDTINSVFCTIYAYFECILFSSAVNGLRAAKHIPPYDRDFILILGCGFRQDGTLTPLLQGRADAALHFRQKQLEKTGKAAVFVPSGGQGSDEPISEAEAISRYLLSQGIPQEAILKEEHSTTTLENMQFSKKLIDEKMPDAKTAFATTNYHVFRSGLWAQIAGLNAEGIGGKTKWWFWPNAFMRECAGLLQKRMIQEALWLMVTVGFFGIVSYLVPR